MKEKLNIKKLFSTSVAKLTMGSFIGQLITILVSPITTRIYNAEELGIYTLLLTIVNMIGPVVCAKYEMAIVTENEERKVYALIVLCTIINLILSTISIIGYTIYLICTNIFSPIYIIYLIIIFIILLLNGLSNVLIYYNNRNKDYDIISRVYVIRILVQNVLLIVLGLLKCSVMGLIIAQLLGMLVGIRKQSERLIPHLKELRCIRKEEIIEVAKSNKKLMLYTAPSNLVNLASYSILNFFITGLYGATTFGYYSMSYRMLGLPLTLISRNIAQIFFEKATTENRKVGGFTKTLWQTTLGLSIVSIIMVAGLELLAPWAFSIFFGESWRISGEYVQILAWMFGIRLVVAALTPALVIVKRQDIELKIQCMFIITSIVIYILCNTLSLPIEQFLTLITICYSIIYIILYMMIYIQSKNNKKRKEVN